MRYKSAPRTGDIHESGKKRSSNEEYEKGIRRYKWWWKEEKKGVRSRVRNYELLEVKLRILIWIMEVIIEGVERKRKNKKAWRVSDGEWWIGDGGVSFSLLQPSVILVFFLFLESEKQRSMSTRVLYACSTFLSHRSNVGGTDTEAFRAALNAGAHHHVTLSIIHYHGA